MNGGNAGFQVGMDQILQPGSNLALQCEGFSFAAA